MAFPALLGNIRAVEVYATVPRGLLLCVRCCVYDDCTRVKSEEYQVNVEVPMAFTAQRTDIIDSADKGESREEM